MSVTVLLHFKHFYKADLWTAIRLNATYASNASQAFVSFLGKILRQYTTISQKHRTEENRRFNPASVSRRLNRYTSKGVALTSLPIKQNMHSYMNANCKVTRSSPPQKKETRMWANAQRDGRPAEYRWRPLFNAASLADAHY